MSRRPIIMIGDVGVGKSMFLRHFIRVEAKEVLGESLVFYVDFGKEPVLVASLEDHLDRKITQQLRNKYQIEIGEERFLRAVYNGEVNDFKRGVNAPYLELDPAKYKDLEIQMLQDLMKDRSEHLRRSLEHIRGTRQRSSVIILDNIDQRRPDFQKQVFLIGQLLAGKWPATVFLALRPSTFYESQETGSLSAYQLRAFTVTPTRCDAVISKRLAWARGNLDLVEDSSVFPKNLLLSGADMKVYLDVLIRAFDQDARLKELMENLSGGNLRMALRFLASFMGSGYVSTQRILDAAAAGGMYIIPPHEFLRAFIYGDYEYYDPTKSEICNVFDITSDDGREHFLMSLVLAHVQRIGESAAGDGYVEVSELYAMAQGLGFSQEQLGPHIGRALSKRLPEAPEGKGAGGPMRITTVGSYMYKSMITQFPYIDAMIVDTPIVEIQVRSQIKDAKSIIDRLNRARLFREYLDAQWERLQLADEQPAFSWPERSAELISEIANALRKAERARNERAELEDPSKRR